MKNHTNVRYWLTIDCQINHLITINCYRLTSIFIDHWFHCLIRPGPLTCAFVGSWLKCLSSGCHTGLKSLTSSVSLKIFLLSECPKITQLQPTSLIMAGLKRFNKISHQITYEHRQLFTYITNWTQRAKTHLCS